MGDIAADNYRKNVLAAVKRWSDKMDRIETELGKFDTELKKLEAAKPPDTKKIDVLKAARKKCADRIDTVWLELRADLMLLKPPKLTKDNEADLIKLPAFIKDLVKKKGVPLGKSGVVLTPDVDFDFKSGSLKKFGLKLKYTW